MERLTGKELANAVSDFVNGADKESKKEFVNTLTHRTHRTLQQLSFGLFLDAIFEWADNAENNFDMRNEYTVETSRKIKELIEFSGVPYI